MELNSYNLIDKAREKTMHFLQVAENDIESLEIKLRAARLERDALAAELDDFDNALTALESTSYVRLNA